MIFGSLQVWQVVCQFSCLYISIAYTLLSKFEFTAWTDNESRLKVDREGHFQRPGFLHIIICIFLGYKASNVVKKLHVTDV